MEPDDTFSIAFEADISGLDRALGELSRKANAFGSALTGALKGAIGGGRSLEGVLRQLGQRISSIALDAALKPLKDLTGGLFGQALSVASGAAPGGSVVPFAKGGVVAAPSYFPTGRQVGLMGEAGAEAILPLKRGADGTLGVAAEKAGGRALPSIVFNVTAADAPSFQRSEAQIQAMLARAAQRGRRGL